jgi:hypothetical protein
MSLRPIFSHSVLQLIPSAAAEQKAKHRFWINNGRDNEIW